VFALLGSVPAVAGGVRVELASKPGSLTAGQPWTARLSVRPSSFAGSVRVVATGPGRIAVTATGSRGSYRARLTFPRAGRWTLAALAGGSRSALGRIVVRAAPPPLVTFAWPTSVDLLPSGSLAVVENGLTRVVRVDPRTGRVAVIASGLAKAYAVAHGSGGELYLSNGSLLQRIDGDAPVTVAVSGAEIGPLAVARDGTILYTAATQAFALVPGGASRAVASGLASPHGIAAAPDGTVLVSDTGADRVLRIDPASGATTTLIRTGQPRGIDVEPDGTIVLVEASSDRVARYSPSGVRLGFVGPVYGDPYDVAAAPAGTVYVVDTAQSGVIRRVAPDGTVSTL
jgi:sugar lactone lactonase YvrE